MRFQAIPTITLALAVALLLVAPISVLAGRRGGRLRGLGGWAGFWAFLAPLLVVLSRAHRWISLPLLAILMFAALKEYFFLAPVRPRDRWAILVAYLAIPYALYPAFVGSFTLFLVAVPVALFLFVPALLSLGSRQAGLLESMGRVLLGIIVFVFCTAHLGLMASSFSRGELELFGILVLAFELPYRLAGRSRPAESPLRPVFGFLFGVALAAALGFWLAPLVGVLPEHGAAAGVLVSVGVIAGALVADAVAQDLGLGPAVSRVGRGAFLDRTVPAVYAAPVFFHALEYLRRLV